MPGTIGPEAASASQSEMLRISTRRLGRSGIEVGEIGLGCWAIGGPDINLGLPMGWGSVGEDEALQGLFAAKALGVNLFDTADVYGHGRSQRILGRFVEQVDREAIVLSSKIGYFSGTSEHPLEPLQMSNQIRISLRNLRSDYIDILSFHNMNFGPDDCYLGPAIETLRELKENGIVRAIGLRGPHTFARDRVDGVTSERSASKYERFLQLANRISPDIVQVRYNMLCPDDFASSGVFEWAERSDVGMVLNKPLAQGLLTDKYATSEPVAFGEGDHRSRKAWFTPECAQIIHKGLADLVPRFGDGFTPLGCALRYSLARSKDAAVLVGFTSADQVRQNVEAYERTHLTDEDLAFIRSRMAPVIEELGEYF